MDLATFGSCADLAAPAGPGSEAKNAATPAICAELNCAAIAFMMAVGLAGLGPLRTPSLNALSWFSR